jgi:hypothetical protein
MEKQYLAVAQLDVVTQLIAGRGRSHLPLFTGTYALGI